MVEQRDALSTDSDSPKVDDKDAGVVSVKTTDQDSVQRCIDGWLKYYLATRLRNPFDEFPLTTR